jgi:outer membrane protein OmpA-like peptidoglycan-associated protein
MQPPTILSEPSSRIVAHGEEVTFSVEATPGSKFQWLRDGERVPGATSASLTLLASPETCGVRFVCEVSNAAGAVYSGEVSMVDRLRELEPFVHRAEMWELEVGWEAPFVPLGAVVDAYCVRIMECVPDGEDNIAEDFIVPGTSNRMVFDLFHNQPLVPAELFRFVVLARVRYQSQEYGVWSAPGPSLVAGTAPPTSRVVLLEGRFPRIFHVKPLVFESKSYNLYPGSDTDLPEIAELLRAFPDMIVSVEGHVNFGAKTEQAIEVSKGRARAVRVRLMELGVDRKRLKDVGHGCSRPRYPRNSSLSSKNRRVQFVIMNPECIN